MRIVLMGTNSFVVPIFESISKEHEIIAVFTRAPKPAGRSMELQKSPVQIWAESKNLPVLNSTKEYNFNPDFVVVISYGVIIRENILNSAPCINIHPSLLPKYRGPSPMQTAILNGDTKSAVCLIEMTNDVDAGDIYMTENFSIDENETNYDVENKVSLIASEMLSKYLKNPGNYPPKPQIGQPSYTHKFTSQDMEIDWSKSPLQIHNQIRALGFGRTKINDLDVKILETKIIDEKLEIIKIQPAGKKPMDWKSFVNGQRGKIEFNK